MAWSWFWGQEAPWTVTYSSSGKTFLCYSFVKVNIICKTQFNSVSSLEIPHFPSLRFYKFNLVKCFTCFPLNLSHLLCFFSSIPFFLTSVLCRSCLVNHIDLERLFCLEDFLTWDHGQLIWFVLELFCMYLFTSACYLYSDAPKPFRLIVLGPVCWNISLCAQTASNKCNGVASNSCFHMDENSLSW